MILNARYDNQKSSVNAAYDQLNRNNSIEKYCNSFYVNNSLELERAIVNEVIQIENIWKKNNQISWIYTQLNTLLRQRYNNDDEALQAMNYFRARMVGEQLQQSQSITTNNVYSKLWPHIEDYERTFAIDFIRNQLPKMFPQLENSLVLSITEFIKNQKNSVIDIYKFFSTPHDFIYYFNLNEFIFIYNNRIQIEEAIDRHVKILLTREFDQNSAAIDIVFKNFKQSYPSYSDLWLVFESNKLSQLLSPFIENSKLRSALDDWFPHDKAFNELFMNFLISQRIPATTTHYLSQNKQQVLQNTYFERFARDQYSEFTKRVYEKVRVLLIRKYKPDSTKVETTMSYLRNKGFERSFTPQMLYNLRLISNSVADELKRIDCLDKVNDKKNLFPYLTNNMCIANEICSQNKGSDDGFLDDEFQKYSPNRINNKFDVTTNIQDEIDETIYDVIRYVLKDKTNEKSDCIADYIKRNDKIISIYSPELIFNETELLNVILPIVNEYHQMFDK